MVPIKELEAQENAAGNRRSVNLKANDKTHITHDGCAGLEDSIQKKLRQFLP
jgi:hypothetical protein